MAFEQDSHLSSVKVQTHHMNNDIFTSKACLQQLLEHNQDVTISGVSAAHQNGVAEREICTIVTMA